MTTTHSACTYDKIEEERLVEKHLPLVHSCARKLWHEGLDYDDLIQLGSIGLIKAIRRFDKTLGNMFSTYAVPLIMGEIRRFLRDDGTVKVSRSLKEIKVKSVNARGELSALLNREPTVSEIAEYIGVDTEKLVLALDACMPCESLQREVYTDGNSDITLGEIISDNFSFSNEIEKIALKSALDTLNPRDKKIIILRYFKGKTQAEISEIIGVSQVQISRIEKKVIESLRKNLL